MTVEKISRDLLVMTCCKRERATAIDTSVAGDSLTRNRPPTSSWASFFLFSVCLHEPWPEVCHHFWWKHLISFVGRKVDRGLVAEMEVPEPRRAESDRRGF